MITIHHERDCPTDPIRGWTLAVIGYGNQGRAQAHNLRDSGHAVLIGARPGRASAELASAEGFAVVATEHLAGAADVAAVLAPDEFHPEIVERLAGMPRRPGRLKLLVFAHSFALQYNPPHFHPSWDVVVIAPAGPGVQLRSRFLEGSGIPALMAVHRDVSGEAEARARAYGAAIGCARAGLLATTPAEEAEVDLFGEQAVLCGGMNALCRAAFETLTAAGYPEELAYLECVQQLRLTAELVERYGVEGMRRRISPTALFGDLTRGERLIDASVRERMSRMLEEIRSGGFAAEWLEAARDPDWPEERLRRACAPAMERAGRTIRQLHEGEPSRPREGAKGVDSAPGNG